MIHILYQNFHDDIKGLEIAVPTKNKTNMDIKYHCEAPLRTPDGSGKVEPT